MKLFINQFGELRGGWAAALALIALYAAQLAAGIALGVFAPFYLFTAEGGATEEAVLAFLERPGIQLLGQGAAILLTVAAALLLFRLLYRRPAAHMGLTGPRSPYAMKDFLAGCGLGAAAISAVVGLLLLTGNGQAIGARFEALADPLFWSWLVLFAGVAVSEELFSRGLLMTVLKTTRSRAVILLVPAAIFAFLHAANPGFGWLPALNLFLIGLAFAVMFIRTGQLWLPIGFHLAWNFFQGNVWGMQVSGLETPSVAETYFTGPALITGGGFGAEGGVMTTFITSVLIMLLWFALPEREDARWSLASDLPLVHRDRKIKPEQED